MSARRPPAWPDRHVWQRRAAADLGNLVTGVIDLSGDTQFAGMDALAAARHVHVPVLFGYGTDDVQFAADVRQVRSATTTRDKPVITVASQAHGVDLVNSAFGYTQVQRAVLRFIDATTRD